MYFKKRVALQFVYNAENWLTVWLIKMLSTDYMKGSRLPILCVGLYNCSETVLQMCVV